MFEDDGGSSLDDPDHHSSSVAGARKESRASLAVGLPVSAAMHQRVPGENAAHEAALAGHTWK